MKVLESERGELLTHLLDVEAKFAGGTPRANDGTSRAMANRYHPGSLGIGAVRMYLFIAVAALLILVAVGAIAIPLLRPTSSGLAAAAWSALIGAGVLIIGSPESMVRRAS